MKVCTKCNEMKDYSFFSRGKAYKDGYLTHCKPCRNKHRQAKGRRDYHPGRARDARLRKMYGVEPEHYKLMYDRAEGKCELCGIEEAQAPKKRLCVDHNHDTEEVRGLLCSSCNAGLGGLGDSVERLEKAITYLKERGSYG